jgi:hypothetical protein
MGGYRISLNMDISHPYRLVGRALTLARLSWAVVALIMLVPTLISWLMFYEVLGQVCDNCVITPAIVEILREMGLSRQLWSAEKLVSTILVGGGWIGAGLVIFALRSHDRRAILMSVFLMLVGPGFGGIPADLATARPEWVLVHRTYIYLASLGFLGLVILFPNGRLAPRWSLWPVVYLMVIFFPNSFMYGSRYDFSTWPPAVVFPVMGLFLLGTLILIPAFRYRRYFSAAERKQARWAVLGFIAAALGIFLTMITATVLLPCTADVLIGKNEVICGFAQSLGYGLSPMMIPIFIGVAITRSRLWDIDVIIRRTLVYGALTATLALIYFGGIVVLQGILMMITGESRSKIVTVATTLVIAALFTPLRRRIQNDIDKRFYRRKYNAERALAEFAAAARQETDLDELKGRVVQVVEGTVQPEQVSLWLVKR